MTHQKGQGGTNGFCSWKLILAKSTKLTSFMFEIYGQLENTFVNAI